MTSFNYFGFDESCGLFQIKKKRGRLRPIRLSLIGEVDVPHVVVFDYGDFEELN